MFELTLPHCFFQLLSVLPSVLQAILYVPLDILFYQNTQQFLANCHWRTRWHHLCSWLYSDQENKVKSGFPNYNMIIAERHQMGIKKTFSHMGDKGFRCYFCLKPHLSLRLSTFISLSVIFKLYFHLQNITAEKLISCCSASIQSSGV